MLVVATFIAFSSAREDLMPVVFLTIFGVIFIGKSVIQTYENEAISRFGPVNNLIEFKALNKAGMVPRCLSGSWK